MRLQTFFVVVFVGIVAIVVGHKFLVGFQVDGKQKGSRYERLPWVIISMVKVRPLDRGGRKAATA